MNNTDKLLRAFIEASGYEIEEVVTTKEWRQASTIHPVTKEQLYLNSFKTEVIDYKVTKKVTESNAHQVILDTQGPEWSCIVKYITNHMGSVEADILDFGILKPMLDYFNRNS